MKTKSKKKNSTKVIRYKKNGISLTEYKAIGGGAGSWSDDILRIPLPQSDTELEVVSEYIFGVKLHLKELHSWGKEGASYEVLEDHDSYYDQEFNDKSHHSSYEVDGCFWRTIIGSMSCGGIARASYGQTKFSGYRNSKRIQKWLDSRRNKNGSPVRTPFVRLAEQIRVRREQNDSR